MAAVKGAVETLVCYSNHKMGELCIEGMNADNFTYSCDMCLRSIIKDKLPWTCGICNYYLCIYCVKATQSVQFSQQNERKANLVSKSRPRRVKPMVCVVSIIGILIHHTFQIFTDSIL